MSEAPSNSSRSSSLFSDDQAGSLDQLESLSKEELIQHIRFYQAANSLYRKHNQELQQKYDEAIAKILGEIQSRMALEDHLTIMRQEFFGASSEKRKKDTEEKSKQIDFECSTQNKNARKAKIQLPSLRFPKLDLVVTRVDFEQAPSCSCCNEQMSKMNQVESSELIEVVTRKFFVNRIEREKYRCSHCHGSIETAPNVPKLAEGGSYSPGFAVEVAVAKYADHMPIERQVKQMHRQGLEGIQENTLIEQTHHLADCVRPIYRLIRRELEEAKILQADETTWRMLEGHPKQSWYLWGFFTGNAAYYCAKESRSSEMANDVLSRCRAKYLVVDGYTAYHSPSKAAGIKIANCWAHARRRFVQAEQNFKSEVQPILDWIAELYEIEKRAQTDEERFNLRQTESKLILDKIREWMFAQQYLPKSSFGKAIDYLKEYWQGLLVFLEDPDIPLDNNLSERSLRGPVLGRKNFYGNHSQKGAETSAILYSICESAKLCGVDPYEYLNYAVREQLRGHQAATPSQYKAKNETPQ